MLTYALPYFAVQARIELARVHLALADLAGARTLMREVDELLREVLLDFGVKAIWRGAQIGCYTCHLGPQNSDVK